MIGGVFWLIGVILIFILSLISLIAKKRNNDKSDGVLLSNVFIVIFFGLVLFVIFKDRCN